MFKKNKDHIYTSIDRVDQLDVLLDSLHKLGIMN